MKLPCTRAASFAVGDNAGPRALAAHAGMLREPALPVPVVVVSAGLVEAPRSDGNCVFVTLAYADDSTATAQPRFRALALRLRLRDHARPHRTRTAVSEIVRVDDYQGFDGTVPERGSRGVIDAPGDHAPSARGHRSALVSLDAGHGTPTNARITQSAACGWSVISGACNRPDALWSSVSSTGEEG